VTRVTDVDLASDLFRETYRNPTKSYVSRLLNRSLTSIRRSVVNAKRFTLDESMSEFLAELSRAPFNVANERFPDVMESLRHSAVPPFENMFVQIDNRAFRRGLRKSPGVMDSWQQQLVPEHSEELIDVTGWLVESKEGQPEVTMTEFFHSDAGEMMSLPFSWLYRTNDVGWKDDDVTSVKGGMFAHGIHGFTDPCVAVRYSRSLDQMPTHHTVEVNEPNGEKFKIHFTVAEYGSTLRYLFAFLATLNNVPKISTEIRQSKHFIGGGQRRKYLDHTVLTLQLPAKQTTTQLARRLVAQARRGWHIVRPHWRLSHPRLGGNYCPTRESHIWGVADARGHATCKQCEARRVWIILPNGRGDPTISVRTHEYNVTHRRMT
jgi:hypothetical protein